MQSRPHATRASWKVLEVRDNNTAVKHIMAFETDALAATQRRHINHGVIVDTKVDLVSNGSGKAHGHGFIFGDVTGESASVLVVRINEVKRRKKVVCFEFLVELVSSREVESEQRAEEELKEKHGHGEWLR